MHRKEAIKTVYREVGGECKDGSTIGIDMNSHNTSVKECLSKTEVVTTDSCPDRVIIPDPTPKLNPDYSKADTNDIYKLIHLLCLPEMKIFMDTTRLLAKHTNDLVGEICNYIKHGKLLQTAVLLLAAQEHIRGSKRNGLVKLLVNAFKGIQSSRYDCPLPSGLILDEFGTTVATHLHAGKEKGTESTDFVPSGLDS
uniref:OSJNBb0020O11.10 protein n=1 Tax=Oryza sativa subsp. japonica TaxID=39947 RepID=Q7XU73_ORYSJ|nr:OSJNBb0020O11.10 [Oryza sativa Japonica Group]